MQSSNPASLLLRVAAAVYDLFPLIALWMVTAGLLLLTTHGDIDVAHPPLVYAITLRGALLVVSAAYFVGSWSRGGQTIGMRAWRLRVVGADGQRLPWSRALLRFAVALVSLAMFGLGFIWCVFDSQRRGWHDIASRSCLVRLQR